MEIKARIDENSDVDSHVNFDANDSNANGWCNNQLLVAVGCACEDFGHCFVSHSQMIKSLPFLHRDAQNIDFHCMQFHLLN